MAEEGLYVVSPLILAKASLEVTLGFIVIVAQTPSWTTSWTIESLVGKSEISPEKKFSERSDNCRKYTIDGMTDK